jgi:hypothetical protein
VVLGGQSNVGQVLGANPGPAPPHGADMQSSFLSGTALTDAVWQPGGAQRTGLINLVQQAPLSGVVVLWIQGENDQGNNSNTYQSDFTSLWSSVNGSRTDVLWVIALLGAGSIFGPACKIRVVQDKICRTLPNCEPLNTDSFIYQINGIGDNQGVHYQNVSSVACWQSMLAIIKKR